MIGKESESQGKGARLVLNEKRVRNPGTARKRMNDERIETNTCVEIGS